MKREEELGRIKNMLEVVENLDTDLHNLYFRLLEEEEKK